MGQARLAAVSTLTTFFTVADRALPKKDPALAADRQLVFAALEERLAAWDAAHPVVSKPAPDPAVAPEPATP